MAKQVQLRRGTTAQHSTFTGAVGEITVDTDKDVVVVHDGVTAGGFPMAKYSKDIAVAVDTVADFPANPNNGDVVIVRDYHSDIKGGGGTFVYDSTRAKSEHNGGTVIDPAKVFPTDWNNQTQLTTWFTAGSSGTGCWVRQYDGAVNVKWFGAKGDGVTNDTKAVQNVVNKKGNIFIEAGDFLVDDIRIYDNTHIFGTGDNTKLIQSLSAEVIGLLWSDSDLPTVILDNVEIRNVKLVGQVVEQGFFEHRHLIALNGVSNCIIEKCSLVGFRGDGIYIGSCSIGGVERHNKNVTIRNCYINGVNKDNRNGISVIDCDTLLIENNYIENTSRNNMPGAIDLEPNDFAYNIIKNATIRGNTIRNCGGNVASISAYFPTAVPTSNINNITIENNFIEGGPTAISVLSSAALIGEDVNNHIRIINNFTKNTNRGFFVKNLSNILVNGNTFKDFKHDCLVGYVDGSSKDVTISNNLFENGASVVGFALTIFSTNGLSISNNIFKDCGTGISDTGAIQFSTSSSSSKVSVLDNTIYTPTNKTVIAIRQQSTHIFDFTTNISYYRNYTSGKPVYMSSNDSNVILQSYLPVVTGSTTAGSGTYSTQYGRYTKVGKLISFYVKVVVNSGHSGSGMIQVTLPTKVAPSPNNEEILCSVNVIGVDSTPKVGLINPALFVNGTGAVRIYEENDMSHKPIPSSSFTVFISGSYFEA